MGLFGNKYDGVSEFDSMRQALSKADPTATHTSASAATAPSGVAAVTGEKADAATVTGGDAGPNAVAEPIGAAQAECLSIVSAGSTWQGTLKIDGSARIDGEFNGEIEARETVHISEGARVDAKVKAAVVVIAGAFQGQVHCSERLELMPRSHIQGELTTKALKIHEGAFIDGLIQMTSPTRRNGSETAPSTSGKKSAVSTIVSTPPATDGQSDA